MSQSMQSPEQATEPRSRTFLNTEQAALHLGLSRSFLNKSRISGSGPCFRKLGSRVIYRLDDIEQWADARRLNSTSEARG